MLKRVALATIFIAFEPQFTIAAPGQIAPASNPPSMVTVTRQVAEFTRIEQELIQHILDKDTAALTDMIALSFESRLASSPMLPKSRVSWIDEVIKEGAASWSINFMATRDHGTTVVVDFILHLEPEEKGLRAKDFFVVDVWVRDGDSWRLDARYQSPVTNLEGYKPMVR